MRDLQQPGRSPVMSCEAMAATSHPLATATAIDVLKRGGNAVDAAVTAVAVLCVVEPAMTGIGGDCFALLCDSEGALTGLNASGPAARAASTDYFLERGIGKIDENSVHSVTVPGAVKGWEALLERHGSWGLDRALQPAIDYARKGYPVTQRVAWDWERQAERLERDEAASRQYLLEGKAPACGSLWRAPELAETLALIAREGAAAFYSGAIAEDIVETVARKGGLLEMDDLASMSVLDAPAITTDYKGLTVAELPPNSHGLTALIILNVLEQFGLQGLDPHSPLRFHLEMEAGRLAYACRDRVIGDPETLAHDVAELASKTFARTLAERIDPARRNRELALPRLPHSDTVYLTVVDRDRNACSLINSLYGGFGAAIATDRTGIMLQNRGACFVVEPGHPNTIDGGKRPLHTIIPGFALKDGRPAISFGVMGGAYQPVGHAHFITNLVDYGMDVQAAIDGPRMFWDLDSGLLRAETSLDGDFIRAMEAMGHPVEPAAAPIGGAQAIRIDWENGILTGGSDPRKDGCALGY